MGLHSAEEHRCFVVFPSRYQFPHPWRWQCRGPVSSATNSPDLAASKCKNAAHREVGGAFA